MHLRFTQKYILRVFPKGTRVTSTNFRPLTAWMHGAQMVAFNMQVTFEVECFESLPFLFLNQPDANFFCN